MPSLETVTTSALTAGFVALAIEYAAKPRLEARKERILAAHRDRRELHDRLLVIGIAAASLDGDRLSSTVSADIRQAIRTENQRTLAKLESESIALADNLGHAAGTYAWRIKDLVICYAAAVRGLLLSDRHAAEKGRLVAELTTPMLGYLAGSPWRPIRRVRDMNEASALVAWHTGKNPMFPKRATSTAHGQAKDSHAIDEVQAE